MQLKRFTDIGEFATRVEPYLLAHEGDALSDARPGFHIATRSYGRR